MYELYQYVRIYLANFRTVFVRMYVNGRLRTYMGSSVYGKPAIQFRSNLEGSFFQGTVDRIKCRDYSSLVPYEVIITNR